MAIAIRHRHAMIETEKTVNRQGVIQCTPTGRGVLGATRNEERPRSHQRMQLVQVTSRRH